jgi:hypothetical protein
MVGDYLLEMMKFGFTLFTITFQEAMDYIMNTGIGGNIFESCSFYLRAPGYVNHIHPLHHIQYMGAYNTNKQKEYRITETNFVKVNKPERLSIHLCKYDITDILYILGPFIQNRNTTFKNIFFELTYSTDINYFGCTHFTRNTEKVTINLNMKKLKTRDLFLNTLIHEIAHMLLPPTTLNNGHTDDFLHVYTCLIHLISAHETTTQFSKTVFLEPSICIATI